VTGALDVLYVLERYPELSQTFVEGELRELGRRGLSARVLADRRGRADAHQPPSTAAHYLGERHGLARVLDAAAPLSRRPRRAGAFLARERSWPPPGGHRRTRGLLRLGPWVPLAARARLLHAHFATEATDLARILSALSGTPYSFAAHATDLFADPGALRRNLRGARFCVTDCEYNRRHILDVAPEAAAKVSVVLLGADVERFERTRPYDPDGPVVAVGRLVAKKGFEDLIGAAARLGDGLAGREVLIVGEGPERPRLERLVAETGAPVRLLGALPHDEVRGVVEGGALFCLPCVVAPDGDRDSMPVAIKEAMALELPVVGTDEVGLPEMVEDDRGRLVAPHDPPALAGALSELLEMDGAARAVLGRRGRQWVSEHCTLTGQADRVLALMAEHAGVPAGALIGDPALA